MNWFEHILGSMHLPAILVDSIELPPFDCLSTGNIVNTKKHDLKIGTNAWVSYHTGNGTFGVMYAHIESDTALKPKPYISGFPTSIYVDGKMSREFRYHMIFNFREHEFLRRMLVNISGGNMQQASIFFQHKSAIIRSMGIKVERGCNVDVFDTNFFSDDMEKMAALQYLQNYDMGSFYDILHGSGTT